MQILVVIGVIAALIYYVFKMRTSAKSSDEESDKPNDGGFFNMFMPQNDATGAYSEKNTDHDEELDDEDDEEDKVLLGDPYNDLEKLAALYEKGILTEEEYSKKKKDILDRI